MCLLEASTNYAHPGLPTSAMVSSGTGRQQYGVDTVQLVLSLKGQKTAILSNLKSRKPELASSTFRQTAHAKEWCHRAGRSLEEEDGLEERGHWTASLGRVGLGWFLPLPPLPLRLL